MRPSLRVTAALMFGSGFSALVYQTAWQRLFRLTFGATTAASAAVLAIFLGGLGLGGAWLGKRVERSTRPLMFYGNLELGITLVAALSPFSTRGMHLLYLGLGGSQALGSVGGTLLRLALSAVVIGPAAVLMGGTLPAAARAVVRDNDAGRSGLALLYSLNTIGAVVGALVGPLLLFALIGNQLTLWGACCVSALVGVLARAIGRTAPDVLAPKPAEIAAPTEPAPSGSDRQTLLVYVVAACVGFVFLALELVWYRALAPLLGGTSVTFGLILACALAGIGLGGYLFSRRGEQAPASLGLLSVTLALEASFVAVPFAWGDGLALVTAHLHGLVNLGFGHLLAGWVFVTAVVVLPASIVSGYQFPILFSLLGRGRELVGQQVGRVYTFNTIGTLSGSLLAGFVLLPSWGSVQLWRLLAQALALLGLACAALAWQRTRQLRALPAPVCAAFLALALSASVGPGPLFFHTPIGAGRLNISKLTPNEVIGLERAVEDRTVWARDGVESAVAIREDDGLAFVVSGKIDGSVVFDRGTQVFCGLLPAALHGHVKTAFVVGLGTGMTAGLLGRLPGMERVEVAELEPSVTEVARRASLVNGDVLHNPRVKLMLGDGRELLLTSRNKYDLIVSEPSNPYRVGVAALFTRDYYLAAASKLREQGLFAQWMQGYEVDARAVSMTMHTLRSVFPQVSLWSTESEDLLFVASLAPQKLDVDRLRQDLRQPAYANWMLRAWGMEGAEGLIAHHLLSPRMLDAFAASFPVAVNTDDTNVLEFEFGRSLGDDRYSVTEDIFRTLPDPALRRPKVNGAVDWQQVENLRRRVGWKMYPGTPSPKTQAVISGCEGNMQRASTLWPAGAEPNDLVEEWVRGWLEAMHGSDGALASAERLRAAGFVAEADLLQGYLSETKKQPAVAVDWLMRAFEELRKTGLPLCDSNDRALRLVERLAAEAPERAVDLLHAVAKGPFAISKSEGVRRQIQLNLGTKLGAPRYCIEGLGSLRARPTWTLETLEARAQCLKLSGAPDAAPAAADLARFERNEPDTFSMNRQSVGRK